MSTLKQRHVQQTQKGTAIPNNPGDMLVLIETDNRVTLQTLGQNVSDTMSGNVCADTNMVNQIASRVDNPLKQPDSLLEYICCQTST